MGCLRALDAQCGDVSLEMIVVDRLGPSVREAVRREFPTATIVESASDAPIPRMRAQAIERASAELVAVIEDHVIVPAGWARSLVEAQREVQGVVGGSVENGATERVVDWAAFLCEYSQCMAPIPSGDVEWLTGNNVVYPRALLDRYRSILLGGGWEDRVHAAMRRDGVRLSCRPEISVLHKKHYTVREYLSQRFLYARSFSGARFAGTALLRRMALAAASALALPPLLLARTVTRVLSKRRHRTELVRALPLIAVFVTAWGLGEALGCLAGPGDSLSSVR